MLRLALVHMPEEHKQEVGQRKETSSARGIWGGVRQWGMSAAAFLLSSFVTYSE